MIPKLHNKNTFLRILLTLFTLQVCCVVFYHLWGYRFIFNADGAGFNIYIHEVLRSGQIFPDVFNTSIEKAFLPFDLLALIFYPLVGNGYLLHGLSGVLFAGILGAAFWRLATTAGLPPIGILFGEIALFSGIFHVFTSFVFGHINYSYFLITMALLLILALKLLHALREQSKMVPILFCLYVMVQVCFVGLSLRLAVCLLVPLLLCWSPFVLGRQSKAKDKTIWHTLLLLVTGYLISYAIYRGVILYQPDFFTVNPGKGSMQAKGLERLFDKFNLLIFLIFNGAGVYPLFEPSAWTWFSFTQVSKVVLIAIGLWEFPHLWRSNRYYFRFFLTLGCISLVLNGLASLKAGVLFDGQSSRYFAPQYFLFTFVIMTCLYTFWERHLTKKSARRYGAGAALAVVLAGFVVNSYVNFVESFFEASFSKDTGLTLTLRKSELECAANKLSELGLRKGYADFWQAQPMTVFTDFKVEVDPVHVGIPLRPNFVGRKDHRLSSQGLAPGSFLVHPGSEFVRRKEFIELYGSPRTNHYFCGLHVATFDYDLATRMTP